MKTFQLNKIAGLIISLIFFKISAQTEQIAKKKEHFNGGLGHFCFSEQNLNISGLNQFLKEDGYSQIDPNQFSWGGGGGFVIKNFFLGGEGAGFLNSKTSNPSNTIAFTGGYGFFNLGYAISTGKRSFLMPLLGAGGGGYQMMISQKNNAANNFKDQLSAPNGSTQLEAGGFMMQAQLAWQYFFCGRDKDGFFVGLKGGYRYSPSSWKLQQNGNILSNSPGINMNGPFVTLTIGGGALVR